MPHAVSYHPTDREQVLLNHDLEITPVEAPLFPGPKTSTFKPASYLASNVEPHGLAVAEWQAQFFGLKSHDFRHRSSPSIPPIRPGAPTVVALFYPDNEDKDVQRRLDAVYLERIARLASLNEQTILYVPPSISQTIRALRSDEHWHVIDDYASIWDMPNNQHQRHNFTHVQPKLFRAFHRKPGVVGFEPEEVYNHPHRSACYNAKAFVTYDAVLRNPFGSERWMYVDAGLFDEFSTPATSRDGRVWGSVLCHGLSTAKFDRSIGVSRDSGVVMGEYMQSLAWGPKDINHAAWTDPTRSWMCQHFIAQAYVGSSLGMLNYAVRFMQTVEDMDANGFYVAREEFVVPHVAVRYPNTVFSIPWKAMEWGDWEHPIKGCYSTYGGEESLPAIGDPLGWMIAEGYRSRRGHLDGTGAFEWPWRKRIGVYGRRY